ncbi:MAG: hypothetical protein ABJL55_19970 [Roseibium sp.]
MIGRDSNDDINGYGIWPWLAGPSLGGLLVLVMFLVANPIS